MSVLVVSPSLMHFFLHFFQGLVARAKETIVTLLLLSLTVLGMM